MSESYSIWRYSYQRNLEVARLSFIKGEGKLLQSILLYQDKSVQKPHVNSSSPENNHHHSDLGGPKGLNQWAWKKTLSSYPETTENNYSEYSIFKDELYSERLCVTSHILPATDLYWSASNQSFKNTAWSTEGFLSKQSLKSLLLVNPSSYFTLSNILLLASLKAPRKEREMRKRLLFPLTQTQIELCLTLVSQHKNNPYFSF